MSHCWRQHRPMYAAEYGRLPTRRHVSPQNRVVPVHPWPEPRNSQYLWIKIF
jgi:hypothetical protein